MPIGFSLGWRGFRTPGATIPPRGNVGQDGDVDELTPVWGPDVLGEAFERLTLPLKPDSEGEVVATLVRYLPLPATVASADSASGRPRGFWQRLGFGARNVAVHRAAPVQVRHARRHIARPLQQRVGVRQHQPGPA